MHALVEDNKVISSVDLEEFICYCYVRIGVLFLIRGNTRMNEGGLVESGGVGGKNRRGKFLF